MGRGQRGRHRRAAGRGQPGARARCSPATPQCRTCWCRCCWSPRSASRSPGIVFVLDGVLIGAGDGTLPRLGRLVVLAAYAPVVLGASVALGGGLVAVWVAFSGVFMGARLVVLIHRRARRRLAGHRRVNTVSRMRPAPVHRDGPGDRRRCTPTFGGYDALAGPASAGCWCCSGVRDLPADLEPRRSAPRSGSPARRRRSASRCGSRASSDALDDADPSLLWAVNLPQLGFGGLLAHALARRAADAEDTRAAAWLRLLVTGFVAVGAAAGPGLRRRGRRARGADVRRRHACCCWPWSGLLFAVLLTRRWPARPSRRRPTARDGTHSTRAAPPGGGTALVGGCVCGAVRQGSR